MEGIPSTPQHTDSHACTRPPSWVTRGNMGGTSRSDGLWDALYIFKTDEIKNETAECIYGQLLASITGTRPEYFIWGHIHECNALSHILVLPSFACARVIFSFRFLGEEIGTQVLKLQWQTLQFLRFFSSVLSPTLEVSVRIPYAKWLQCLKT